MISSGGCRQTKSHRNLYTLLVIITIVRILEYRMKYSPATKLKEKLAKYTLDSGESKLIPNLIQPGCVDTSSLRVNSDFLKLIFSDPKPG